MEYLLSVFVLLIAIGAAQFVHDICKARRKRGEIARDEMERLRRHYCSFERNNM